MPTCMWLLCYMTILCDLLKRYTLRWRHNERDSVSNHQPHDCLLNRLFRRRSKKTSKLRVTGLCDGNSPVNSRHKGPVTRKMFPFDIVIMVIYGLPRESIIVWSEAVSIRGSISQIFFSWNPNLVEPNEYDYFMFGGDHREVFTCRDSVVVDVCGDFHIIMDSAPSKQISTFAKHGE